METLLREACRSPVMQKMDVLARDATGVGLFVVWSCGERHGQIPVCADENELSPFCRLLHAVPQGLRRCVTSHSLLALAACTRGGVIEGRCHGGTCVVAAPASVSVLPSGAEFVLASSCAFTMSNRNRGWRITRQLAKDLGLDLAQLRRAYAKLPDLRGEKRRVIGEIVDAAAAALTESMRAQVRGHAVARANDQRGIEKKLHDALQSSRDPAFRHAVGSAHTALVDVVLSVVGGNPNLPVTVADIAQVAHITPNHFSMLFRRQTGSTFSAFLAEKRFARATELLGDLTLSIAEVATRCGFSSANYFAKVFHKRVGMSPHVWRQTKPGSNSSDLKR